MTVKEFEQWVTFWLDYENGISDSIYADWQRLILKERHEILTVRNGLLFKNLTKKCTTQS